uniref:BZIP83 n=1 Tax=Fagopyrum tataricum TaxID=62330 RepID=A0A7D6ER83_FAGTA|nr:bZIP83 [Fagopyrum tataricum]
MGTDLNFKGFGIEPLVEGNGSETPTMNFPLVRRSSVYSLTFDEFQTSLGKDFGSLNMDELLKSIWSAEETQNSASVAPAGVGVGGNQGNFLQRQGSLTLPRTISHKTVDEVWRDMSKEFGNGKDTVVGPSIPQAQRQPTLGEITLEEFLVRAGVVREDNNINSNNNNTSNQLAGKPNPGGFWGELAQANSNNSGFGISFQQPRIVENNAQISLQSTNLPLNVNGVRSSQPQAITPQLPQLPQQSQLPHQQLIFPKQVPVSYAPPPMAIPVPSSTQLASPRVKGRVAGMVDPTVNGGLPHGSPALQGGCGLGIVGLGAGLGVGTGSPASLSSDGLVSNGDTPSVSPVPYMFNGGLRGRRSNNTVEKVIERRHRRMIKNRESAARSRARKQAYTTDLEDEVAKLKEENQALRIKQEKIIEMQKNQALEKVDEVREAKRRCLRRTQTGPW